MNCHSPRGELGKCRLLILGCSWPSNHERAAASRALRLLTALTSSSRNVLRRMSPARRAKLSRRPCFPRLRQARSHPASTDRAGRRARCGARGGSRCRMDSRCAPFPPSRSVGEPRASRCPAEESRARARIQRLRCRDGWHERGRSARAVQRTDRPVGSAVQLHLRRSLQAEGGSASRLEGQGSDAWLHVTARSASLGADARCAAT